MKEVILINMALFLCLAACHSDRDSDLHLSKEARFVLGEASAIDEDLLAGVRFADLSADALQQRQFAWDLWADLASESEGFAKWQTWYAKEDLARIFRRLYEGLGPEGRRLRRPFREDEISAALRWNDREQFQESSWNKERFELWLARYDSNLKKRSIPGINKILMNEAALRFFLVHYAEIRLCSRDARCQDLSFPKGAAFLKVAWRRGQDNFSLLSYPTDASALARQLQAESWLANGQWIPGESASYRMESPSGQIFHLAGLHSSLRLEEGWFWSSLWLSEGEGAFAFDRPAKLGAPWTHYQLCTSLTFAKPLLTPELDQAFKERESAWCSNPYLEAGAHNQKTNCIGCHQHAGKPWSEANFVERLQNDLSSMTMASEEASDRSDRIWSVYNGPEPFAGYINQDIDYFDAHDFHEP